MTQHRRYICFENYRRAVVVVKNQKVELPVTRVEIDLSQLEKNYLSIKERIGQDVGVISVLKADAYGHGLLPIAKKLSDLGTSQIGVASLAEAQVLREAGIRTPLLMLYPPTNNELAQLLDLEVEVTLNNLSAAMLMNDLATRKKTKALIHVQADTGLHRFGLRSEQLLDFVLKVKKLPHLQLQGLWTHFIDVAHNQTLSQHELHQFLTILELLSSKGVVIPVIHTANSAAISHFPLAYKKEIYTKSMPGAKVMVRPGCLLYGTYTPEAGFSTPSIISSLVSQVTDISQVLKGETIGYFEQFAAEKALRIATIPVGWGNSGYLTTPTLALVNGKYCKGVGLISSNNLALDVSSLESCELGTPVYLIKSDDKKLSVEQVAKASGLFLNRFTSTLGAKIPRVYFDS